MMRGVWAWTLLCAWLLVIACGGDRESGSKLDAAMNGDGDGDGDGSGGGSGGDGDGDGDGDYDDPADGPGPWDAVSAGGSMACGLHESGALYCWGSNTNGGLGQSMAVTSTNTPMQVGAETDWSAPAAGGCGVRDGGTLYCWGDGALAIASLHSVAQIDATAGWTALSLDSPNNCGLRGGQLHCWGPWLTMPTPPVTRVGADADWVQLSSGAVTGLSTGVTCAIKDDGTLWCMGDNAFGSLADGTVAGSAASPVQIGSDSDWATVAGGKTVCAIKDDGSLWCWGSNQVGGCGQGTTAGIACGGGGVEQGCLVQPTRVGQDSDWTAVSVGNRVCGIRAPGRLYCWGRNQTLTTPEPDAAVYATPARIGHGADWVEVTSAGSLVCGRKAAGKAYCFGDNRHGQLGDGVGDHGADAAECSVDCALSPVEVVAP